MKDAREKADRRIDLLFDARHIRQSGIGTYIRTQLPHLQEATAREGLTLGVLADPDSAPALGPDTEVIHAEPAQAAMYTLAEQSVWRHAFDTARPRAVWLPHYPYPLARLLPRHRGISLYATVHDTIHLLPEQISGQSRARRFYARAMLGADARLCHRIFTVSEATAATLRDIEPKAPITVTPIPIDEVWLQPADPDLSPVDGRYLLYVGNTKVYKNLPLVLEVFAGLANTIPHKLVIAGGGASLRTLDDRVRRLAEDNPDRVLVTGQLDFAALRALVANAELLIMPSLHEGAGLPPLEAMASRTAVVASSIPSIRETCGDGADFFDPHRPDQLAALLRKYCADDGARAALAERGHTHVLARQQQIRATAAADEICAELVGSRT
ncbi:glycosyltransferase family 1 protein [Mycobacterium sp. GA-2829]|uniref:glycosyltransferase family 4 protein n=1 Tax=Mycobacterium sp. GA-2829 TaxID=1772283 RepID=UPI0007404DCA|nr:glycosyltransferase family 1 protein [Mycobacterium sp. GA-2829]KUI25453.1 glycosyl transferase family 1 [Mycobacterium sp. GA-2829]